MEQLYGEGTAGSMVDSSRLVFTQRRQGYGRGQTSVTLWPPTWHWPESPGSSLSLNACTCARDSRKVPADPIMQPAADETASGDVGAILTVESVEAS